jgi:outer membrane protein OmpA-like peptidoglycan-associated protein
MELPDDHYAVGKANLRDNVKLLITVFGGVAGVLLAGTPFSGIGSLEFLSWRFGIALSFLVAAALSLFLALWRLLLVLQPGTADPAVLRKDFSVSSLERALRSEVETVRKDFAGMTAVLLPTPLKTVEELDERMEGAWKRYSEANEDAREEAKQAFNELFEARARLNHWVAFDWLKVRYLQAMKVTLFLGAIALLTLTGFATTIGGEKKTATTATTVVVLGDLKPSVPKRTPALDAIKFLPGKTSLNSEAMAALAKASAYLRANDDMGIVLYAYTDTTAGVKLNEKLARQRADVVRNVLIGEAGLSASRVFLAPLAKTDLPNLTGPEVDNEANRSVRLVAIPLPQGR